ncbi:MAG: hypothetical protein ACRDWV_01830 [Acidimicrobiales bacterium]
MAKIEITSTTLRVVIEGADKVLALKGSLEVPLSHVKGARADPEAARGWQGLRLPGSYIPGLITAGSFRKDGEWSFFDVHRPGNALVIELDGHEHYSRLVIEVPDPTATASAINAAVT